MPAAATMTAPSEEGASVSAAAVALEAGPDAGSDGGDGGGVPLTVVHTCGHISPGNRDGTVFACEAPDCGNEDHADLNAARNIAALAGIDVPTVNRPGSDQHRHPRCA